MKTEQDIFSLFSQIVKVSCGMRHSVFLGADGKVFVSGSSKVFPMLHLQVIWKLALETNILYYTRLLFMS